VAVVADQRTWVLVPSTLRLHLAKEIHKNPTARLSVPRSAKHGRGMSRSDQGWAVLVVSISVAWDGLGLDGVQAMERGGLGVGRSAFVMS